MAEAAKSAAGDLWPAVLRQALYGADRRIPPAELHTATAALAALRGPDKIGLFTLNYDLLLEAALKEVLNEWHIGEKVSTRSTGRRANSGFEVHHLHGVLPPTGTSAASVILTISDYNELGRRNRPWQVAALQDALQRGPLLLAGTSYRDPDIRQWMHEILADDDGSGYPVVVFLARESLGLTRSQFEAVRQPLIDQWAAIGVNVLTTGDHLDAAQALRELPMLRQENYAPPNSRAERIWHRHSLAFDELQQEYSAQLEDDIRTIQEVLPDTANMTLWIADDRQKLVRWAANDRIYKRLDDLRRIESGHDSEWIAGRCLARSDLLAQDVDQTPTTRWRSVMAVPLVLAVEGGPAFPYGVLTTASTASLDDQPLDLVDQTYANLSIEWSERLVRTHDSAF